MRTVPQLDSAVGWAIAASPKRTNIGLWWPIAGFWTLKGSLDSPRRGCNKPAQGNALVVLHIFLYFFLTGAERIPTPGEVSHPLQAEPERLRSRRIGTVGAIHVTAQLSDHTQHDSELWRLLRRCLMMDHHPYRLPFRRIEDRFAIHVRAASSQPAQHQDPPRDDQVHAQARQQTVESLNSRSSMRHPDFHVRNRTSTIHRVQ